VKALVTGGAGFIGSHLVDLLLAEGHEVAIVDNLATGKRGNLAADAKFYEVDIRNQNLTQVFAEVRPEVVFHQAAQMSVKVSTENPLYDAEVNVVGLINVLNSCVTNGVRKVVFASSGATYGNPEYLPINEAHPQRPASPYGITKMVAEHYLRFYALDHNLAFTALRYGNVYGPRQDPFGEGGVIAIFTRQLLDGKAPTIHWDGEQIRDYVYATDIAAANLRAATAGDGQCYSIATGAGTTVNVLYRQLCDALGLWIEPQRSGRRPGDLRTAIFDCSRAQAELGWHAQVSLAEGIARTVAYFKEENAVLGR